jgi:predicted amidohydrolase YtcJ
MTKADMIITNGRIYTVDPAQPWAEALACRDGRILAVGSNQDIRSIAGPGTLRFDAAGHLILPGLVDAHVHFLQYALRRKQISLFGVSDFNQVRERVATAVQRAQPGHWIIGWGWDENLWNIQPNAHHLDEIAPNNPVVLARMDMHTWWVNSVVLQQAKINRETEDPPESVIERDDAGYPTGLLREWNAIALVEQHIPEPDNSTQLSWMREALAEAHQLGLTGFHDQRVEREGEQSLRLFQKLRREGHLKHRVHANIAADFLAEAVTLGLQPGFGDDLLWLGHMKAFADGTMGSLTALMLHPFSNAPNNLGLAVTDKDQLWELAWQACRAGFPLSVHAIGDRAVRNILDVFSELETGNLASELALPHRIEHVQLIHPDDLGRLAQHNIVASMQPVHIQTDWATADHVWGERARYTYAFRSLLNQGTRVAFGSDAPVAPLNPMLGIYSAVTRKDAAGQPNGGWYPEEQLTVAEAIYAYTMEPAYLSGKSHLSGSLAPGKWADFTLLSQNLFEIPYDAITETTVEQTFFAGELLFSR